MRIFGVYLAVFLSICFVANCVTGAPQANNVSGASEYLSIHVGQGHSVSSEDVTAWIKNGANEAVSNLGTIIGKNALAARIADLQKNSLEGDGKIHVYVGANGHPHNIFAGSPYPSLFIAPLPNPSGAPARPGNDPQGVKQAMHHEFMHTLLGKFNEGFAEPIANVFIPFYSVPTPTQPGGDAFRELFSLVMLDAMASLPQSALEPFHLRNILSYKPAAHKGTCSTFFSQGAEATKQFLRDSLQNELTTYYQPLLEQKQPPQTEAAALYQDILFANSAGYVTPNEAAAARDPLAFLGLVTMNYIIETTSVDTFFSVYFSSGKEQTSLGMSWDDIEVNLLLTLQTKYQGALSLPSYTTARSALANEPCYRENKWIDREQCVQANAMTTFESFFDEYMQATPPASGGAQTSIHNAVQARLLQQEGNLDIGLYLGKDTDLQTYCTGDKWVTP